MVHRLNSVPRALASLCMAGALVGCSSSSRVDPVGPDYARQLGSGDSALRRITNPDELPDLASAYESFGRYQSFLLNAIDRSELWFNAPSSRQFYPFELDGESITHERAWASVAAFDQAVRQARSSEEFVQDVMRRFDVYESVGWDGSGTVLYTGYYSPVFPASKVRTAEYSVPLYQRPPDLVTDPVTGEPMGRRTASGETIPYYTRAEIEDGQMLRGTELVWLKNELDAYIIHVNGSARLRMSDGQSMYIGYAGKTDGDYVGLGRSMVDEGLISENNLSLTAIKQYFKRDPQRVKELMRRNDSYVFFTEYDGSRWPSGSLGVPVTEQCTLATDKKIYPRGGVVLVDTQAVSLSYQKKPFLQFMLDQDTGGAIKAPGRADIFMGTGETAEILAGGQYAEGRLYYFFLKPEFAAANATASARPN